MFSYLEIDLESVQILGSDLDDDYQNKLLNIVLAPTTIADQKPKIVFSSIHGTGAVASVPAMETLGINVISVPEQSNFDGRFPTVKSPNPENAEALSKGIEIFRNASFCALLYPHLSQIRTDRNVPPNKDVTKSSFCSTLLSSFGCSKS